MIALDRVSYTYPHSPVAALHDLTLAVPAGRALLCTGRSGCGKSTLLRLINGLAPHCLHGTVQGQIQVAGLDVSRTGPAAIAEQVGTLFQDPERQFFALTVDDEIALALQWRLWPSEQVRQAVAASMDLLGITELAGRSIFGLSEGQKQKVALAALLAGNPGVLLLDEPSANLDPESTRDLAQTLCRLKARGLTLLIVDHRLWWLREVADDVLVLDAGRCVARGDFALLDDSSLREKYGLRCPHMDQVPTLPAQDTPPAAAALTCRNLHFGYTRDTPLFCGAEHAFAAGEVVALVGSNGVGKTTLARLLTGLEKPSAGAVVVRGAEIPPRKLPHHVQLVLQNAGHQLRMNSVEAELLDAAALPRTAPEIVRRRVESTLDEFGIEPLRHRHPQSLSGGEKQRLAVACAAVRRPSVLILDEPTSGLDGENMRRMARSVRTVARQGAAVVVITHDPEFMQEACTKQLLLPPSETRNAHHGGAA